MGLYSLDNLLRKERNPSKQTRNTNGVEARAIFRLRENPKED